MLHYESDFQAYTTFFAHICQNIGNESSLEVKLKKKKPLTKTFPVSISLVFSSTLKHYTHDQQK